MSESENKIWFSFIENGAYIGSEPNFFDISEQPWFEELQKAFPAIKSEFQNANKDIFIPYYNQTFANEPENWKIMPLIFWRKPNLKNLEHFPTTTQVIKNIPFITSCAISKLKANSKIKPHTGDSNVMFRIHFPLIVPSALPNCGFRVKDKTVPWEEGVPIAFCDAHLHEAWNETEKDRIILILDVIRPEFASKTDLIVAKMRNALFFQFLFQKTSILEHTPKFIRKCMMIFPLIFSYPFVLYQKKKLFK